MFANHYSIKKRTYNELPKYEENIRIIFKPKLKEIKNITKKFSNLYINDNINKRLKF